MEKINIAQLLKDCPKGMELDCAMWNNVTLKCVDIDSAYPIVVTHQAGENIYVAEFTEYGYWNQVENAKCVIFPKGKTSWEGFVPPCKFNTGDIIFTRCASGNIWISIFKKKGSFGEVETYADYYNTKNNNLDYCRINTSGQSLCIEKNIAAQRLATEEEREKLLKAIEGKGYRWNSENKTLERFIKPKFKVGDRIVHKVNKESPFTITEITNDCYKGGTQYKILIKQQDNFELVPNKFDISSLVPFESRVLIRSYDGYMWVPAFWGCILDRKQNRYLTTRGAYEYCIPYEGNEHLLGKTDDCSEFYKNW